MPPVANGVRVDRRDSQLVRRARLGRQRVVQRWADNVVASDLDGDWSALGWRRVASCGRSVVTDDGRVGVRTGEGRAWFTGVARCGSVWSCEACRSKIMRARSEELLRIEAEHRATGGTVTMLTLTCRHDSSMSLSELRSGMAQAWRSLQQSKWWRAWRSKWAGMVTAREVTTSLEQGNNGWHLHYHILLFWQPRFSQCIDEALELFDGVGAEKWANRVESRLHSRPDRHGWHHKEMQPGQVGYVSKLAAEITGGAYKTRDALGAILGGMSDGDACAFARWSEWNSAMAGAHSVVVSRDLKESFSVQALDDEANQSIVEDDQGGELVGTVSRVDYLALVRELRAWEVLEAVEASAEHRALVRCNADPPREALARTEAVWLRSRSWGPRPKPKVAA